MQLECTSRHFGGSFQSWRSKPSKKAAKTLNEYLDALSAMLNWMVQNGRACGNPLRTVRKVQTDGKAVRVRRALTNEEMRRLLEVAGERKQVYLAAFYTGLRRGELAALEWADVHLEETKPSMLVRASTTKNGKEAVIPLHPDLAEALAELKSRSASESPVFRALMPKMRVFRADLKNAGILFLDALGRRADFHALRHTLGTNLGRMGVAPRVAMEAMRHRDIKLTTRLYTDASQLPTAEAFARLPSFRGASEGGYTQKCTHLSDADGQNASLSGTGQDTVKAQQHAVNKGDSTIWLRMAQRGRMMRMVRAVGFEPTTPTV
jgi:integrase